MGIKDNLEKELFRLQELKHKINKDIFELEKKINAQGEKNGGNTKSKTDK